MKFGACKHRFLSVLLALLLALTPIQAVAEAAAQSAKTTDVSLSSEIPVESLDLDFSTVVLDQVGGTVAVKMNNGSTNWSPGASGGSKTISFTNASYNISVDYSSGTSSWATGTVGGTQGKVTVKQNTSYNSRSGDVIFLDNQKGGQYKVHIVQAGAQRPTATNTNTPTPTKTPTPTNSPTPVPRIKADKTSLTFSNGASSQSVKLSNVKGSVSVDYGGNTSSWVTAGVGGTTGTISVKANNSYSRRSGTVVFIDNGTGYSVSITVTQNAAPTPTNTPTNTPTPVPRIKADKTSLTFSNGASSQTVKLSNVKGSVSVDYSGNTSSWVTASVGGTTGTISVKANNSYSRRSGTVVFIDNGTGYSVSITVTQNAAPTPTNTPTNTPTPIVKITSNKTALTFSNGASSQTVKLSNVKGSVTVDYGANTSSWVTASVGGTTGTISVKANTSYSKRTGTVVFVDNGTGYSVSISITQSGAPTPTPTPRPKLAISKTSLTVGNGASGQSLTISNAVGQLEVDYDGNTSSWVTAGVGGSTLTITVKANTTYTKRTGRVIVIDRATGQSVSVTITQNAAPTPTPKPKLAADKTSFTVSNSGATLSVKLSNVTGPLSVDYGGNTGSWATASVGGNTGTIIVKSNKNYSKRSGTVIFIDNGTGSSVTVTITQNAAPTPTPTNTPTPRPKMSSTVTEVTFSYGASTRSVPLRNVVGQVTVDYDGNTGSWINAGCGGSTGTISVKANTGYTERTGKVVFIDNSTGDSVIVTVKQSGAPKPTATPSPTPKLSSDKQEITFTHQSGTQKVTLTNVSGQITVDYSGNTQSWVTAAFGGNTGTITVKANAGYSERSGQVVFIDHGNGQHVIVIVKQAGAPKPTPVPKLTVNKANLKFPYTASEQKVTIGNVVGQVDVDYDANTSSWVLGSFGGNTGTISVKTNTNQVPRTGQVVFIDRSTGQSIIVVVEQEAGPEPTPTNTPTPTLKLSASAKDLHFSYEAESRTITIENAVGEISFEYEDISDSSWLSCFGGGNRYTISVKSNVKHTNRSGRIAFIDHGNGQSVLVSVKQDALFDDRLAVDPCFLTFDEKAGTQKVQLKNVEGNITIEYSAGAERWISASGGGTSYNIAVKENLTFKDRTGQVVFIDRKTGNSTIVDVEQTHRQISGPFPVTFVLNKYRSTVVEQMPYREYKLPTMFDGVPIEDAWPQHTFLGWFTQEVGGTVIKSTDKVDSFRDTVYAHWRSPDAIKVYCYFNYEPVAAKYQEMYAEPGSVYEKMPPAGERYGYTFSGWYTEPEGGEYIHAGMEVRNNLTKLYAHWKPKKVQVDFVNLKEYDETVRGATRLFVDFGAPIGDVFPKTVNAKGHRISGWVDRQGNHYTEDTIISTEEPIELVALWSATDEFTVYFDGNGNYDATVMEPMTFKYGDECILPWADFDDGVGFECWGDTPDGKGKKFQPNTVYKDIDDGKGSIVLYALWNDYYKIYYHDGITGEVIGVDDMPHVFTVRGKKDFPGLKLNGMDFLGWREADDYHGPTGDYIEYGAASYYVSEASRDLSLYPVYEVRDGRRPVFFYDTYQANPISIGFIDASVTSFALPGPQAYFSTQYRFRYWQVYDPVTGEVKGEYEPCKTYDFSSLLKGSRSLILKAYWEFTPEEIVFNLGYDNLVDVVIATTPEITLPAPQRRGYVFVGWGEKPGLVLYEPGASYTVPKYGKTLYAVWEPQVVTVVYYNSLNGTIIESVDVATTSKIANNSINAAGMSFYGWTDEKPESDSLNDLGWMFDTLERDKFYQPGDLVMDLPFEDGPVSLYGCFLLDGIDYEGTTLFYLTNNGTPVPTPAYFKFGDTITITDAEMKRDGCKFTGWKLLDENAAGKVFPYKAGDTVPLVSVINVLFLEAQWESEYKLEYELGYDGKKGDDISKKYLPGDTIKTTDLNVPERKGYYQKGWTTSNGGVYGLDDYIPVPFEDVTITVAWEKIEFYIYYHSGFDSDIYTPILSDGYTKLCYDKSKFSWIEVEGYTFLGWVEEDTLGGGWTVDPSRVITQEKDDYRELKSDLHVYACYKEISAPTDGSVMVIYNPQGGEGGPGIEYFFPDKESYYISDVEPTRLGYKLSGWSMYDKDRAEFTAKELFDDDYEDNVIRLYAVWIPETTNYKKLELQARYGKEIMPDYYFECEYTSPGWQKINDHSYFVIKTKNVSESSNNKCMVSDVLIVEYNYGKWNLYGEAAGYSFRHQIEYDILTSYGDTEGRIRKVLADLGLAIAGKVPFAGQMLMVFDVGGALLDVASNWGKKGEEVAINKTVAAVANAIYTIIADETGSHTIAGDFVSELYPEIVDVVTDAYLENRADVLVALELLYSCVKTGTLAISSHPTEVVDKLKEVATRIKKKLTKETEKVILEKGEDILEEGLDYDRFSMDIGALDVVFFLSDAIIDTVKCFANVKVKDPFGDFNVALQTYQDEIVAHGFSEDIANTFPDVIDKIFEAYYKIN
ncbi:MAG: InlB B-repeat-containing protein [Lachnospiraceae bacterium]|nr:InlB B-repeat-containing protein [Lachnospiraceae bacterium]